MREYNSLVLQQDPRANFNKEYQQCVKCVMDTIGNPDIIFDDNGICNYCHEYEENILPKLEDKENNKIRFEEAIRKIKLSGKGKRYDCILGLSGGVDSSFLAYIAKINGLRPLVIHFDNGWNSELAVNNIEQLVSRLGFELMTYVMDWEEFRELQRSYIKASVLDLEVPTDHLIFGALYRMASKYNIKYILSGWNYTSEAILPASWSYKRKFDAKNLKSIHSTFSDKRLKKLPIFGFRKSLQYQLIGRIQSVSLLNLIEYNKNHAKDFLIKNLGWRDYGAKHHESIFTRFYQGYILPIKFNIDKRKAHFSTLICSGQMSRQEALLELSKPTYSISQQKEDFAYVAKKLGFSMNEFEDLLNQTSRSHDDFGDEEAYWRVYYRLMDIIAPLKPFFKKIANR